MKKMRKLMCAVLVIAMVITILPVSFAAEDTELTRMVKLAKVRLQIPEEYTEFESSKSIRGTRNIYSLIWKTADEEEPEEIKVTIRDDGLILSYYCSGDRMGRNSGFAEIEKEEAEKKAEEWINRVYPGYLENLGEPVINVPTFFNNDYSVNYYRIINGIEFFDHIYVDVNKYNGKITYASANWETTKNIAKPENVIGEEKAAEILGKEMGFEISYRKLPKENRAILVYSPKETGIELDALTGERFVRTYIDDSDDLATEEDAATPEAPMTGGSAGGGVTMDKNESNVTLTEKELEGIKEVESLLSKSDIASIIKRMSGTDVASFTVKGVSYRKREDMGKEKYFAYVTLIHENGSGEVTLNAETGELISLYSYKYSDSRGKNEKSREAMKIVCENFIGNWAKDVKDNLVEKSYSDYGGYFNFVQDVDGIPYHENSVYMRVDPYSGKITSYNKYWDHETEFESADGIISAEDAAKIYVTAAEVILDYERNNISRASGEAQKLDLIYRLKKSFNFVSAKDGKLLDWNLEPYDKDEEEEYAMPSDLSGHWLEKVAEKLAKNGIVVYNGESFRPDDMITYKEAKELAEKFNLSYLFAYYGERNELENEFEDNDKLTRETAVVYIVDMKGYESAAKINGIYKTGFADEGSISPGRLGYVAIAKGLGIVSGVNGKFEPQRNITRAEFVMMLYNSLGK